jgi:hypothetical protein
VQREFDHGSKVKFFKKVDWTIATIATIYQLPLLPTTTFDFLNMVWRQAVLSRRLTTSAYNNITESEIWQSFTVRAFNQVVVPVKDFQNDQAVVMHPVRCTGCRPWRGGAPRKDDIFTEKDGLYRALNGRLPARVEAIFAIEDPVLNTVHQVALVREYRAVAGGTLQTPSRLVQVTIRDDDRAYRLIPIQSIVSLAHLIFNKKENKCFVNSHIDLTVYNEIY